MAEGRINYGLGMIEATLKGFSAADGEDVVTKNCLCVTIVNKK